MKISAVMKTDLKTITSKEPITDAAKIMKSADIGSLPVVDNGKLVGIVTDRDIVTRAIASGKNLSECTIKDVMSTSVKACNEYDDLDTALTYLGKGQVHRLPVVDKANKLVGIVALSDFAKSEKNKTLLGETVQEILS